MAILYSVVARRNVILARHAQCAGNFAEVADLVLSRLEHDAAEPGKKMTLQSGSYCYHYHQAGGDGGIVFLCIADADYDRAKCFKFLEAVKSAFERQYGPVSGPNSRARTAIPFAMNTEFSVVMAAEMKRVVQDVDSVAGAAAGEAGGDAAAGDPDKIARVRDELQAVKDVMVANIDSIVERGERLELLVDKTEALSSESVSFRRGARRVQQRMWWQNAKMKIVLAVVVLLVLYGIVSASCGGPLWPKCV